MEDPAPQTSESIMKTHLLYILSTLAILAIANYVSIEIVVLYKHYRTIWAHNVIAQELASDKVTYEIRGQTITAAQATDADLKKALFYERIRAQTCAESIHAIQDLLSDSVVAN